MVTEAKKRFARHVKITLSCESHATRYFEHHAKCTTRSFWCKRRKN